MASQRVSEQLRDRGTAVHDKTRSPLVIQILVVLRNSEVAKQRGREIGWSDRPFLDCAPVFFGSSDYLTMPQSATGKAHRHYFRPMVSAVGTILSSH